MTEIHPAFQIKLPESQGTVFLTKQGLVNLRAKINEKIGTELPGSRPAGTTLEQWNAHQSAMSSQLNARQAQEQRDARLRGETDAQTARNIVAQANANTEDKLTWRPGRDGEPDARVAVWSKPSDLIPGRPIHIHARRNPVSGAREYRYASAIFPGIVQDWVPWAKFSQAFRYSSHLWTEESRHSV